MNRTKKIVLVFLCVLFLLSKTKGQVCSGSFGDPVVNINFGSGNATFGPAIPETNYAYVSGTPSDGQYTIVKTTSGLNTGWHQDVTNHTPNNPQGYFMVVNADYNQGIFYQKTITVCPKTTYQFSAYIINILRNAGIRPKVRFSIEYNNIVENRPAEEIPEGSSTAWIQKTLNFTVPAGVTTITLKMTNENPGGIGNDLAIDDITFRACGPLVISSLADGRDKVAFCEGGIVELKASVSTGYQDEAFQWQRYDGTSWSNIPGATSKQTQVDLTGAIPGAYKYRLAVTERENIGSTSCGVVSTEIVIDILRKPEPQANDVSECVGKDIAIGVSDAFSYEWRDPKGTIISDKQIHIIQNAAFSDAGVYTVTVKNEAGCPSSTSMRLTVEPLVVAGINTTEEKICEGTSVNLLADGGSTYRWSPALGLSNDKIANPIATPNLTTTYTVTVSNGGVCYDTKQVTINVIKKAMANAGGDQKIIAGESVALNGVIEGDNVDFYWTPSAYLDDPKKLNPIANPPANTTYTLHAVSNDGCNVSVDEVNIIVFPKIEFSNTFTPNGDGVNDTWQIPFISLFPTSKLKILNRNGNVVYENNKGIAWDGKHEGKDQPIGTYYYTLYLNNDYKIYSGWLLLAR